VGVGVVPGGAGRRAGVPGGNFDWQFVRTKNLNRGWTRIKTKPSAV
jgi:hypothetical protein